jgi:two-component system, LytTR family, response regulator
MRTLIVDDERLARSELRRLLGAHPQVEIVGEAANVGEARLRVAELRPQLLLLDIQMPDGSGFDLLAALEDAPEVIFTTAFDAYALKAFEVNALDYLQKPIEATRLGAALARAGARVAKALSKLAGNQRIFIRDGERCWFVPLADVALLESEGNYTRVYFGSQRPLILRSLTQLEQRLDPRQFFRANRRHIVNLEFVAQVVAAAAEGGLKLVLKNDVAIEISRRRAAEFKALASL